MKTLFHFLNYKNMPRADKNSFFVKKATGFDKVKKTYALYFVETKKSYIKHTWDEIKALCRGQRNFKQKSFLSEAEANAWLQTFEKEQVDSTTDARLNYPARVEMSRHSNLAIYYCDCSFEKNEYCGVAVICRNSDPPYQRKYIEDHHRTTHQRGEILGILYSLEHFMEINADVQTRKFNGITIFTDSMTSVSLINDWAPNNFVKQGTVIWKNARGKAVKSQDVIMKILELQRTITDLGMKFFLHFIPRDLNAAADRLSKRNQEIDATACLKINQ